MLVQTKVAKRQRGKEAATEPVQVKAKEKPASFRAKFDNLDMRAFKGMLGAVQDSHSGPIPQESVVDVVVYDSQVDVLMSDSQVPKVHCQGSRSGKFIMSNYREWAPNQASSGWITGG